MKKTLYIILGAALIAAVVLVIVWQTRPTGQPEQETRSAVVEQGTMFVAISASGSIQPQRRANLAFELPGQVAEVAVKVEDMVEAGDLLAKLDAEQLTFQVRQAQAALTSAEAQLAQLQAGPQPEEIAAAEANVRAAEARLNAATADLDQLRGGADAAQIAAAEADLAAAITQQRAAEEAHDMTMKCFTFKVPAGTPLPNGTIASENTEMTICPALGKPEEQARYSLEAANEALAAAQARYNELLAGADANLIRAAQANVQAAAAQRDAAQAQLNRLLAGPTDEQVATAEAQVEQAQAALALAELSLKKTELHAPFGGTVAMVNVTAGEMAPTGLPAIVLVDTSKLRVDISVDELDVGRLAEGQTTKVTLDALPDVTPSGTLTGIVERIAPAATFEEGVVSYRVTIALDTTGVSNRSLIRTGMTANTTIVVAELTDVLMIPTWIVRVDRDTGQTYVDRQVGATTERVDVTLGVRYGGVAQVLDGLSEGDVAVWVPDEFFGFESE